jgi:hypothetical protein
VAPLQNISHSFPNFIFTSMHVCEIYHLAKQILDIWGAYKKFTKIRGLVIFLSLLIILLVLLVYIVGVLNVKLY